MVPRIPNNRQSSFICLALQCERTRLNLPCSGAMAHGDAALMVFIHDARSSPYSSRKIRQDKPVSWAATGAEIDSRQIIPHNLVSWIKISFPVLTAEFPSLPGRYRNRRPGCGGRWMTTLGDVTTGRGGGAADCVGGSCWRTEPKMGRRYRGKRTAERNRRPAFTFWLLQGCHEGATLTL